ncbi:single-stranded DNA-binding protein [Campylobacter gastrosuis]|uniref:Single-stranded DNA-binding protein n=1 Tax=Campylobacter gastrosuis TaxID=2974576 RepID=A0ABT7HTN9_9BACT|nr:single-stranded DNA-binding protein [Campylobacter gastrosuis]MDL0089734.1 single-stranded DNA-binding protein [Campylobacter gastrosuis]
MFNKVVLVGNLTRDIELRYTPSGSAIGNTGIAVTRKFTTNGEKREETCFIDISFFGKYAEIANQYLNKGSKVLIEGRLVFQQWTDNNGQNRSKHSVSVENMEMLGGTAGQNQGGYSQNRFNDGGGYAQNSGNFNQGYQNSYQQNSQPQRPQQNKRANFEDQEIDINADRYESDENIPF